MVCRVWCRIFRQIIVTNRCNARCNMCDVLACNGMDEKMSMGNLNTQIRIWQRCMEFRQEI